MYNEGTVYISRKLNIFDLLDKEEIEKIELGVEREEAFKFTKEQFDERFLCDLKFDLQLLKEVLRMWQEVRVDCKLESFLSEIKENSNLKKGKLIIFTESKETAEYVALSIEESVGEEVICFTGSTNDSIRRVIKANFDPNYKEIAKDDKYRVLVTTDVLAEGINLHRANVIVNYDLPWNPTKIMQRVGRINRVGTKHAELYIYNFFPTSKSSEHISLEDNITSKIQMFHDILGEDSKFITEDEQITTHELFRKITNDITEEEDGILSELSYLKKIREIRDNDKELFNKVKNMPKKIKTARKQTECSENGLLTFFRKGYLKKFYLTGQQISEELIFENAISYIAADKKDKREDIKDDYYDFLKQNKESFEEALIKDEVEETTVESKKGRSNAKDIIRALKDCRKHSEFTDLELANIDTYIYLLENGDLPSRIVKDGNKILKTAISPMKFYKLLESIIPESYLNMVITEDETTDSENVDIEIILSEYMIK